jgi:hypothetical protein
MPYVVATSSVDAAGSHNYSVYFRLNKLLPRFHPKPTSAIKAVATVDDGLDPVGLGADVVSQFPNTTVPCYMEGVTEATLYRSQHLNELVLPHGPGQIARLELFVGTPDKPTLKANVRVATPQMTDMVPSGTGPGAYMSVPSGPYGRLLGCDSRVPGEITWSEYAKLHRDGKASVG